ncbi:MAG: hypothetical protein KFB93_06790 [Simkaniaceae bacterium]|nr:MAG: hypothetical protein KFB93_06790 [Simkaniaceae bacterium]
MKKFILLLVALCGTLAAGDFRREFLDEVMKFSEMNPPEIAKQQQSFIQGFFDNPHQQMTGKDAEVRPLFVTAQGDFERTLALFLKEKKVKFIGGVIHTPTPTTALCTKGEISENLVNESIMRDQRRLYTVMKRPGIIREFLKNGGRLIVAYPEKGREKRTPEQLALFEEAKATYRGIKDSPLPIDELDPEMIGATYYIRTNDNEDFAFAIMARQANAPEDDQTWALWFGSRDDLEVTERMTAFNLFIKPFLSVRRPAKSSL